MGYLGPRVTYSITSDVMISPTQTIGNRIMEMSQWGVFLFENPEGEFQKAFRTIGAFSVYGDLGFLEFGGLEFYRSEVREEEARKLLRTGDVVEGKIPNLSDEAMVNLYFEAEVGRTSWRVGSRAVPVERFLLDQGRAFARLKDLADAVKKREHRDLIKIGRGEVVV